MTTLYFVDLDDTTFWCNAECRVTNKKTGETFRSADYWPYYSDTETYECSFAEYRSTEHFAKSEPVTHVHSWLKTLQNDPNNKFVYLTTRGTFDNVDAVKETIRSFGLKVDEMLFAGDLMVQYPTMTSGEAKAAIIYNMLEIFGNIDSTITFSMIDDDKKNLQAVIDHYQLLPNRKKTFKKVCNKLIWHNAEIGLLQPFYG